MALPASLDKTAPADADNPSAGAAQIRALKTFIEDVFGITDATNYTAAPFAISTAGQVTVAQPRMLLQNGGPTQVSVGFAGATGHGLFYDSATQAIGIAIAGAKVGYLNSAGLSIPLIGPITTPGSGTQVIASDGFLNAGTLRIAGQAAGDLLVAVNATTMSRLPIGPTANYALLTTPATTMGMGWGEVSRPADLEQARNDLRLVASGSAITVEFAKGHHINIDGTLRRCTTKPSLTALEASTTNYLYAYWGSTDINLEAAVTGYTVAAVSGRPEKTGDTTRRLLGMAEGHVGGGVPTNPLQTISFDNRQRRSDVRVLTANRSTTALGFVELNSEIRVPFLTWDDETVKAHASGGLPGTAADAQPYLAIGFDGTTAEEGGCGQLRTFVPLPFSCVAERALSEGGHYATLLGKTDNVAFALTCQGGATAGMRTSLVVDIQG